MGDGCFLLKAILNSTMGLEEIRNDPMYSVGDFHEIPVVMYDDHRFILPVILEAQKDELIPRSSVLVGFDQHHDAVPPDLGKIPLLREKGYPQEEFKRMVQDDRSPQDDDWLRAGMELGLISDAAIFGVNRGSDVEREFEDHKGEKHQIFLEPCLPGQLLGHQGSLGDTIKSDEMAEFWDLLGWQKPAARGETFQFSEVPSRIVDFDLDCFAIEWNDFVLPWPDEVFEEWFCKRSEYRTTVGISGQGFVAGLMKGAGIITIAREPTCCGGEIKTAEIFGKLNHYVFGGDLIF